jgi:protein phosphatase
MTAQLRSELLKQRTTRTSVLLGSWMVALVLLVALFGVRFYLDQQWYVGEANGRVAIFRGIPSEVLGVPLGHAVVVTALPAGDAQRLQFYRQLPIGISAESRSAADDIVRQIGVDLRRADAARQRALQDQRSGSSGSAGGGTTGGSGTRNGGSDGRHGSGHHHARMAA